MAATTDKTDFSTPKAVVIENADSNKFNLLETVLVQANFWEHLEQSWRDSALEKDDFSIIVVPDFGKFNSFPSTITDPELVEHLVDLLYEHQFTHVTIAGSMNSAGLVLENRDFYSLADLVGYGFVTKNGHDYEVVDVADDAQEAGFSPGSILAGSTLSQTWVDAHYRISFAKNKTDEENFYALSLQSILAVLPLKHKDYHYHHRFNTGEVVTELLQLTPVHFSIIDAVISNHGNAGSRVEKAIETCSIIAANDILLADIAAVQKMGLDPAASSITAKFIRSNGLPEPLVIDGPLHPYENWINVHPLLSDSVRKRSKWSALDMSLQPWLQSIDPERFPFKDMLNERINEKVAGYFSKLDQNPGNFWVMVGLNYLLSAIYEGVQTWRVMLDKDRLQYREVPLGFEPGDYTKKSYDAIPQELLSLKELLKNLKADSNGLRWRYLDKSVLFDFSHDIPVDYDDFASRVDISKSISYMNDYIGGVIVQVDNDRQRRVIRQAERNLYLPQPNYLALYQGNVIDVSKIERLKYTKDRQQMFWKTVKSENESARFDDGVVTFSRLDNGDTRITVFGRQEFVLPPFWQAVNLDRFPEIKDVLVIHAYTTFFTRTMANFEAVYEGREVRIGSPWNPEQGEVENETDIAELLMDYYERIQGALEPYMGDISNFIADLKTTQPAVRGVVDRDGFTHVKPGLNHDGAQTDKTGENETMGKVFNLVSDELLKFWSELAAAVQKDWGDYQYHD